MINRKMTVLLAGSMMAMPSVSHAQAGEGVNDGIVDIVVTAQRREESLQSTPVTLTALDSAALDRRLVTNVMDMAGQVPNLSIDPVTGVGNAARIFLRGVGEDQSQFNADPAVGIYIDGVYYARTNGALFDFLDIERVEVLRGPQGTLYGRNTPAGAVNIITRRPDNEFGGQAELVYGRFNQFEAKGTVHGPIVEDVLAASASILIKQRDGTSYSTTLDRDVNRRSVISGRVSLAFNPTSTLRTRLTFDRTWDDGDAFVPTSNFAGPPEDLFETASEARPEATFRSSGIAFQADWELGALTIGSITAYRDLAQSGLLDNDGEARLISGFEFAAEQSQFSQEITASLSTDSFNGIVGFYFFDENNTYDAVTLIGSRTNLATRIARPDYSVQYTRSYAIFGQGTYELASGFRLTLGGRYTWDRKRFENDQPSVPGVFTARRSWRNFSPRVSVDYRPSEAVFLYATYSEGYKAGGFNRSNVRIVAETPYNQENVTSYEIGLKTDLFDRRLRFNINGFYNDYQDLQLSSFDPDTGTTRRFNAAAATTKGIEIEASARPVNGLDLYGSLGYLDAKYDRFVDRVGTEIVDVSFRKLKGAPKWQYNAGFNYNFDLASAGNIRFGAEASYRSLVYNNVANTPAIATRARTLVNASIAYTTPDERWTLMASGRNLFDKKYPLNGIFIGGLISALYPADPMTWSLSARYRF